jgi:hypothetical protein
MNNNYSLIAIGLLLAYFFFFRNVETLENEPEKDHLEQYVAERVVTLIKQNPRLSFNTFKSILKENNNQHKNLENEDTFNKLQVLGINITKSDVLHVL